MYSSSANGTCAAPWLAISRTTTGRVLTSRSTRMRPTAAQLSRRNSARSSRFPKSVASIIAMSDGRPDPAQSVRHDRACPRVRLLAAPPPKGPPSLGWRPDGPALLASPPVTVSPKRSLACRESIGPSSTELDEVLAKDRQRATADHLFGPRLTVPPPNPAEFPTSLADGPGPVR